MSKKALFISAFLLSANLLASQNTQATLGDVKEAVYKLIVKQNKGNAFSSNMDKRLIDIEDVTKSITSPKDDDEYSKYIKRFVFNNNSSLKNISTTTKE